MNHELSNSTVDLEGVKNILNVFYDYIELCENFNWPNKNTNCEEISRAFKLSSFVEDSIKKINDCGESEKFISLLSKYYNEKQNKIVLLKQDLFFKASDKVFEKVLVSDVNDEITNFTFMIYSKNYGECRMKSILKDIILQSQSQSIIENYIHDKKSDSHDILRIKKELFLFDLKEQTHLIQKILEPMFMDNVYNNMTLFFMIILENNTEYSEIIEIIGKCIVEKIGVRNSSNVLLWSSIICDMDKKLLINVFSQNKYIFDEIILFLMYFADYLRKNAICDLSSTKEDFLYHDISCENITEFVSCLESSPILIESLKIFIKGQCWNTYISIDTNDPKNNKEIYDSNVDLFL